MDLQLPKEVTEPLGLTYMKVLLLLSLLFTSRGFLTAYIFRPQALEHSHKRHIHIAGYEYSL